MSSLFESMVTLVVVAPLLFEIYKVVPYAFVREEQVDFQCVLEWCQADGTVWIVSRLETSALAQAGIPNKSQLVSIDGIRLVFKSKKSYHNWFKKNPVQIDVETVWVIQVRNELIPVVMLPTISEESIPVYWSPNVPSVAKNHPYVRWSCEWCGETGQYYTFPNITRTGILETFFSR